MNYIKPQKPLIQDGKGIYPITTIDQVVRADGRRFSENEFNRVFQRNLLRPTLQTTTSNGVTCTNNGDGTYTLNGTASKELAFILVSKIKNNFIGKKIIGCPYIKQGRSGAHLYVALTNQDDSWLKSIIDDGDGVIIDDGYYLETYILVPNGFTCNNLVFKPMITEDLNATYDDFVSFDDSVITGINSGIKMDLLWTNASPTSAFTSQTISLDLSEYKLFLFINYTDTNNNFIFIDILSKGLLTSSFSIYSKNVIIYARNIEITENNISIKDAYVNANINNIGYIPYQIYGVK